MDMKQYIKPEVEVTDLGMKVFMLDVSQTPADPEWEVLGKERSTDAWEEF